MKKASWLVIGTWRFALPGVKAAAEILAISGRCLDAVERAVNIVEENPSVYSVGLGAIPNENGEVEVDAGIMDGRTLRSGAVAGIKNLLYAVSIGRKVMERTRHNLLVGNAAEEFAQKMGFKKTNLLTAKGIAIWKKRMSGKRPWLFGHDTIGVVALDRRGNMAAGTSSSGIALKIRGRAGDAPVIGAGFYADNEIGGAAATGVGESIMKGCLCFHAVQLMRQGYMPKKAAETALKYAHQRLLRGNSWPGKMALICCNNKGNFGAAANHPYFCFAVASNNLKPKLVKVRSIKS
jgi:N4-(beta-N-acetylglucosaminyl)-L-asparaginase